MGADEVLGRAQLATHIAENLFQLSQVFIATNGSVSERLLEWGVGTAHVRPSPANPREECEQDSGGELPIGPVRRGD